MGPEIFGIFFFIHRKAKEQKSAAPQQCMGCFCSSAQMMMLSYDGHLWAITAIIFIIVTIDANAQTLHKAYEFIGQLYIQVSLPILIGL